MRKILAAGLCAVLLLSGCSASGPAMTASERAAKAAKLDSRTAEHMNRLGLHLFSELRKQDGEDGNLLISPYSITTALALAYNGSAGGTAEELGSLLGYAPGELKDLNDSQRALLPLLNDAGPGIQLESANSVWANTGVPLRKAYLRISEKYYGAEVKTADLGAGESVTAVNQWVADHTAGKISQMLERPPGPESAALLINALYFKGTWENKFPVERSELAGFRLANGSAVEVLLMKQSGRYLYAEGEDWQAVRLPYGEGQMDMLVILPAKQSSLAEVLNELRQSGLPAAEEYSELGGTIALPRFTAGYNTDLKGVVQALGVKLAFDPNKADFSALADTDEAVFISSILHQTYLEVTEAGTEAAASTVVVMEMGGAPKAAEGFEMRVDRPFFFAIEDNQTGICLFLGAIGNPALTP